MELNYTTLPMVDLSRSQEGTNYIETFANEVAAGLGKENKSLPSRYFYDGQGSKLFQQIMNLPEYYLTNCEYDLLTTHKEAMAQHFGSEGYFHLIDLGAGDALKTKILLQELDKEDRPFEYVPVDISRDAMEQLTHSLKQELPAVAVQAVVGEYFQALEWLQENKAERKVVLFLGSNIGNFETEDSRTFLCSIRSYLQPGDKLLVGIDLRKDPDILVPAYSDSQGITAAFNLNLLTRINNELGGDFELEKFKHFALYDPQEGAMKSYLLSKEKQTVTVAATGQSYTFDAWEAIHTENSYKYTISQIQQLGKDCGFTMERVFQEKNQYFADVLFTVD